MGLIRSGAVAAGVGICAILLLLIIGGRLFSELFDGRAGLSMAQLVLLCVVLLALSVICTSVYVQGALGQFKPLLRQSLPFLGSSLACVPLARWSVERGLMGDEGTAFMMAYAATFIGVAILHGFALRRLVRGL